MRSRFALFAGLLAVAGGAALLVGPDAVAAQTFPPRGMHLIMGNPSNAKSSAADKNNFLMRKAYFALAYDNAKGTPKWVSWHLSPAYLGSAPRKRSFDTDISLPSGFNEITHKTYNGSGFQRGHMCPHSDRAANQEMSFATFVMTNIVPQSPACNEGSWESLEAYGRYLVRNKGKELFIVSGPIGKGGEGDNGPADTITAGKLSVTVPAKVFKVILVVDNPGDGSNPTTWANSHSRLIAVIMPNDMTVEWDNWPKYRRSVKQVEDETGYKFFTAAPGVTAAMKAKVDDETIPKLPKGH